MHATSCLALLLAGGGIQAGCAGEEPNVPPLTVFAAASTSDVITEAAEAFEQARGLPVRCSFAASSTLAKQILLGAPADVFLSADAEWMDELERAGAIDAATRCDLLANQLVLIAPPDSSLEVKLPREGEPDKSPAGVSRLAIADPAHVPAGRYARQALQYLGWWDELRPQLITAQDVRAALRLVEMGEADAGIVYATDARPSPRVRVVVVFPPESHAPVRYPIAACRDAQGRAAEFIEFLHSAAAGERFTRRGFAVLTPEQVEPR